MVLAGIVNKSLVAAMSRPEPSDRFCGGDGMAFPRFNRCMTWDTSDGDMHRIHQPDGWRVRNNLPGDPVLVPGSSFFANDRGSHAVSTAETDRWASGRDMRQPGSCSRFRPAHQSDVAGFSVGNTRAFTNRFPCLEFQGASDAARLHARR